MRIMLRDFNLNKNIYIFMYCVLANIYNTYKPYYENTYSIRFSRLIFEQKLLKMKFKVLGKSYNIILQQLLK